MSGPGFLFDTSVWIALAFGAHPLHAPARAAFLAASAARPAFFCRATQQSVLRLLSTAAVAKAFGVPTPTNHAALSILDAFRSSPSVAYADEPRNLFPRWRALADIPTASPKRWMDAYLAAFAIEAALEFVTGDADFSAFPDLHTALLVPQAPATSQPPGQGAGNTP